MINSAEGLARRVTRAGVRRLPFRGYRRPWLVGDAVAGLTVTAYLVPQVMAYAEVAGLPPVTGLWAIIGPLAVYAVLGSSRLLSVGPESTTALMTAVALMPLAAGDPLRYASLAATLALLTGFICLLGRLLRLGFLADLLSRPVLVGYMAGVALIMMAGQLGKITGVPVSGDGFAAEAGSFVSGLGQLRWPTVALSAALLAGLFLLHRFAPRAPGPLIMVALAAVVVAAFSLQDEGIDVVGAVPIGLPVPAIPWLSPADVGLLIVPAIGMALVGYTDNVLTARAFAVKRGEFIDANQELTALGTANISSALLHGFPVSSSGSRTALADSVGARTQLYSLVAFVLVLITLVAAGPLLAVFPRPALGALVIFAALQLIDIDEMQRIARFRRSELALTVVTTMAVLGLGVIAGIAVAVGLSVMDLLRRVARPHDGILGYVSGMAGMHDVDDFPSAQRIPGLVVYRYDAPLCFANAEDFRRRALAAATGPPPGRDLATRVPVEWFVLNAEANVDIDITAADALEQVRAELARRDVVFAMARVKQDLLADLQAAGFVDNVGADRIFPTLPTAVAAYLEAYRRAHGELPQGVRQSPLPNDPLADDTS
ncbi:SulP family inorganic anion transporter [Nakamurella sp.]|uniref:SulP family inorganic anion transporter n=1 Tax=Nakamurella sp. TaxID=1869182 RepID=UPI003783E61C